MVTSPRSKVNKIYSVGRSPYFKVFRLGKTCFWLPMAWQQNDDLKYVPTILGWLYITIQLLLMKTISSTSDGNCPVSLLPSPGYTPQRFVLNLIFAWFSKFGISFSTQCSGEPAFVFFLQGRIPSQKTAKIYPWKSAKKPCPPKNYVHPDGKKGVSQSCHPFISRGKSLLTSIPEVPPCPFVQISRFPSYKALQGGKTYQPDGFRFGGDGYFFASCFCCFGVMWMLSENQSSRDTGGPGIEAGFPLVFHWANISTPIPA